MRVCSNRHEVDIAWPRLATNPFPPCSVCGSADLLEVGVMLIGLVSSVCSVVV
jgi:hypothetical protein